MKEKTSLEKIESKMKWGTAILGFLHAVSLGFWGIAAYIMANYAWDAWHIVVLTIALIFMALMVGIQLTLLENMNKPDRKPKRKRTKST